MINFDINSSDIPYGFYDYYNNLVTSLNGEWFEIKTDKLELYGNLYVGQNSIVPREEKYLNIYLMKNIEFNEFITIVQKLKEKIPYDKEISKLYISMHCSPPLVSFLTKNFLESNLKNQIVDLIITKHLDNKNKSKITVENDIYMPEGEDIEYVIDCLTRALLQSLEGYADREYITKNIKSYYREIIADLDSYILKDDKGNNIGHLTYILQNRIAKIEDIFIEDSERGEGKSKVLIDYLEKLLVAKNIEKLYGSIYFNKEEEVELLYKKLKNNSWELEGILLEAKEGAIYGE